MGSYRWIGVVLLCTILFISRFLPHPDNFTPFLALSMFIGFYSRGRWWSLLLPSMVLGLSDLKMGLYPGWAFVYIPFILAVFVGFYVKLRPLSFIGFGVLASLGFFFISNLGVWIYSGLYPMSLSGLLNCYVAAIPFFHMTLLSTALYSTVIVSTSYLFFGMGRKVQVIS